MYKVGNYYHSGDYSYSISANQVSTKKETHAYLMMKNEAYPGFTWQSGGQTVENTSEVGGGGVTYEGHDKWFSPLPLSTFKNVSYYDTSGSGHNKG
jgi:hypothetical protein